MISVDRLSFSYTKRPFIQDMSFCVENGEIFGFLGPSGAGKSTLQKILTGILTGYEGSVSVLGTQVRERKKDFYEHIGVDFEFPSLYEKLTARENLDFFASLYKKRAYSAMELLKLVGLENDADKRVEAYSKGMKSRLNFVKALAHDPELLFLDEPTSGLDPSNAAVMKELIKAQREKGKTIILTTHNMYDAAELCDRVAFIVDAQLRALDTPHNFIMRGPERALKYSWSENGEEKSALTPLNAISGDEELQYLINNNKLLTTHTTEHTLNDVFIELTGRRLV